MAIAYYNWPIELLRIDGFIHQNFVCYRDFSTIFMFTFRLYC